ncbi:2-hydroxyacid dehydrogenase [Mahella australiensis]|uniref:D-isomer specific 2-hydroxyacid dehydrogenase NAD-binding protein n=1 Tax=Mahella australiensis (strain DSM 15567 / CIP 107919 / 50-1 BON) TaxID=697281 RepID=F3ZXB2_MAHA5|nr:D-glycerate dehydrogenase [Mahella australiensis]AEE96569.1 D-isomer specific 2-hydroxyacid dehydrogenase NAD-binding protein [Mahella australiensis 50-1 BON]
MAKWKVYVTRLLPPKAMEALYNNPDLEVEVNPEDRPLTRQELLENVRGRDAVITQLVDKIDAEVMDAAKGVKIFANYAVGYDNIDVAAATERGILVTNTPDVLTDTTADLAWALLFAAARCIVPADKFTREGKYKGWAPMLFLGQDITGKTLGVIGSGRIGTAFAKKSKGFDMTVLYNDVNPNPRFEAETGGRFVDKETLLKESDFISLHVPLLPSTRHLISENEFKMMKKTAVLINTSRGPVIDEQALVKALKEGEIWAVGLDVYENEPELTPGLAELDNAVLLPHIASASIETRTKMGLMDVDNVVAALNGQLPPNCINPEAFKK